MTNFKYIQDMSLEEFAEWLDKYGIFDASPWAEWFSEKYCDNCEAIKCKYEDTEKQLGFTPYRFGDYSGDVECSYCELEGKCRFFMDLDEPPDNLTTIKMWLAENKEENSKN